MRLQTPKRARNRLLLTAFLLLISFLIVRSMTTATARAGFSGPSFTKTFTPDTIGPGSTSTLQFTISNGSGDSVDSISFTDNMPAEIVVADAPMVVNECGGTLTAVSGTSSVTLTDGGVAGNASCTISVDVTSSTVGTHSNTSNPLGSSAGTGGTAVADLTVNADRPGFTKSFAPSTVDIGGRSTLTFTFDNSQGSEEINGLSFTDEFPVGMEIADPANFTTTCDGVFSTLDAEPGSSSMQINLQAFPTIPIGESCIIAVDVVATSSGTLENSTTDLLATVGFSFSQSSGKANAVLNVQTATLLLRKQFVDDPTPAGDTVALRYQIDNRDRFDDATNITFTDDLDATLTGLVAAGLPRSGDCGSSTLSGTGTLTFSGGSLPAAASCVFTVTLQVPAGATSGAYPSSSSVVNGQIGGSPSTGTAASDTLFISPIPAFSKQFIDDPVAAGDDVTLQFSITNSSATSAATDITFDDELTTFLPFPVSATTASEPCGAGSSLQLVGLGIEEQGLRLTSGTLPPSASCTFTATIAIPDGFASGVYLNETTNIMATIDTETVEGDTASDTLEVVSAPILRKSFVDDPVLPGEIVTLEYTFEMDEEEPADATAIAFTDDLTVVLPNLEAINLPQNDVCGSGSQLSGTTLLVFSGGSLSPGESCTFSVQLQMPSDPILPDKLPSTTSNITAEVLGLAVTGLPAIDELIVGGLAFSMEFIDAPTIPGDRVALQFMLENESDTFNVTNLSFSNDLSGMVDDVTLVLPLPPTPCGAGSSLINFSTTSFTLAGGELAPNSSCTFSVTLQVDSSVPESTYTNITSNLSAAFDGTPVTLDPTTAEITIDTNLIQMSKSYSGEAPLGGETTTLLFTLQNLHQVYIASSLTFTDDLEASLTGLVALPPLPTEPCGAGSQLTGTSLLTLANATLSPNELCQFEITVQVPDDVEEGEMYENITSDAAATMDVYDVYGAAASDTLVIGSLPPPPPPPPPPPTDYFAFLPMIQNNEYVEPVLIAPDLVVTSVSVRDGFAEIVIENVGNTAVADPFWVDLYINPTTPPTMVNQTWDTVGTKGAAWGVQGAALPLAAGASLTLTLNDAYFNETLSNFPDVVGVNTAVYAQVDSANAATTYGAVLEAHEIENEAYNNVIGPVLAAP